MREVIVFATGDSRKLRTWSNVPYFFTHTLEQHGVKVNRVDLSENKRLKLIWTITFGLFFKMILGKKTSYTYFRSFTHYLDVSFRMKKALRTYKESEANIFLTFSFSSKRLSNKPAILFGDWTYDYHFNHFAERRPDRMERQSLERENANIEGADLVLPLFPRVAEYMKARYKNPHIHYLGNVINSVQESSESEILELKKKSRSIVFIGSSRYVDGARSLVQAFSQFKKECAELALDVIGMTGEHFEQPLPQGVVCHGYLNKDKSAERELYYQILREARILVNTTPKWGAFSSTLEAMYHYTPVLVTPYSEFVETFGAEIDFGYYCSDNEADSIVKHLRKAFADPGYDELCIRANGAAREHTWDAFIAKMLKEIETLSGTPVDSPESLQSDLA